MLALTLLLVSSTAAPAQTHEELNPVYKHLRQEGLQYTKRVTLPLAAPVMADGLTGAQQLAVIKKEVGGDFTMSQFFDRSPVAPHLLRINTLKPSDPENPPRAVDVFFVAYGDMKKIASKEFLDRLVSVNKNEGEGKSLDAKELEKRGIELDPKNKDHEGYGWAKFDVFDKVRLETTGRSFWSQTPDSIIVAMHMDPRFKNDAEHPNRWRSLIKSGGETKFGPPVPYDAVGYYMKITRLESPPGAVFVEAHIGFGEPPGWFNNNNMLRSKLPPALQQKVRDIRRELLSVMEKK